MTRLPKAELLPLVQRFFRNYLVQVRGASPHTIRVYRDTLRLLFSYLAKERRHCAVSKLTLDDLTADSIRCFLSHLETARDNKAATRNIRLSAIRAFFRHLIEHDLSRAGEYHRVLSLSGKRSEVRAARYLEPEEVKLLLSQPDRATESGFRDYALMLFLYNTGARVGEALNVSVEDLSLTPPRQARLFGKGGKERFCPLWPETAKTLSQLPAVRDGRVGVRVFRNRHGYGLTRDGVAYLLRKHASAAAQVSPGFGRRRISPHVLRHSCAVALLQSGVDITVIRDYLGHSSIATTNRYVSTNLKMKRDVLEQFWNRAGISPTRTRPWKPKPDLMEYLESL